MRSFGDHARFALRMLIRHKRFSTLAILSLSIAIALNTTMYSVLDTLVAPKLAMHEPERLYAFFFYGDFKRQIPSVEKAQAYRSVTFAKELTGRAGTPLSDQYVQRGSALREARVATVLPNYFRVLGARASAGRLITESDMDAPGRPVVISERLWNQLFADKDSFEPSTFQTGAGESRVVVGLIPYEADFPGANTDVWQLVSSSQLPNVLPSLARLKPDVTPEQAIAELDVIRLRFAQTTGELNASESGFRFIQATKRPFQVLAFHYALIGAVVAVLLIGCANLANLQLARGVARARELATRAAVGASRRDIVIQLVAESAWLAFGGLLLGSVFTVWGMRLVNANVPPMVADYMTHAQVSWRVLVFAVLATLVCLVLMGLLPAIRVSRVDVNELLKSGAGTGKSRSARRQYGALVVAEVSLALALLCSASLMMKSAAEVFMFEPGFEERGLVRTFIAASARDASDRRTKRNLYDEVITSSLLVPGVSHAAVLLHGAPRSHSVSIAEAGGSKEYPLPSMWGYVIVSDDYMTTMGITLTRGRNFSPGETVPSVIVDEKTASYLWPGQDPIGRLVKLDSANRRTPWYAVVGVVQRHEPWFLRSEYDREVARSRRLGNVYVLLGNDSTRLRLPTEREPYTASFTVYVRTEDDPIKVGLTLREALLGRGHSYVSTPRAGEATSGIAYLRAKHGFMTALFGVFSALALGLAALGVYAIIAHMVAQRTREFGVRLAVGASALDIRRLVLTEGRVMALAGIAVGLVMTPFGAKWVRSFTFDDYDRFDSRVFAVAAVALFLTALIASYIPARRAMRINPVEALRND